MAAAGSGTAGSAGAGIGCRTAGMMGWTFAPGMLGWTAAAGMLGWTAAAGSSSVSGNR